MWRRKILVKAKGLETGQGRREIFLPNPKHFSSYAYHSVLETSLKRLCSVSGLCRLLLASVDELFHLHGPTQLEHSCFRLRFNKKLPAVVTEVLCAVPGAF